MKKFLICLCMAFALICGVGAFAAQNTDIIQISGDFVPKRVLTADGKLWLDKKAVENTNPGSAVCKNFPWLRRFDGVENIVSFSGDAAVDKDGNVWIVKAGSKVRVEKADISNVKKVLYYSDYYSVVLKKDGTLCTYRFGLNSDFFPYEEYTYDQRGYDIRIENVVDIVHYYHGTLALKSDGTVWGIEVGDLRPYPLPGTIRQYKTDECPLNNIVSIFANGGSAVACASDGSVYCLYGAPFRFGTQHTSKTIEKLPIRDVKFAYLDTQHSIFVKKDGTVWFAGYPREEDFMTYYKSIDGNSYTHTENHIKDITQVDIKNVKFAWRSGFVKSNNTFWVLGNRAPFYDSIGNQISSVNPGNFEVACLTEEAEEVEIKYEGTTENTTLPEENTNPIESENKNPSDINFGDLPDPSELLDKINGKYPWENNVVAVPIKGGSNKTDTGEKTDNNEKTEEKIKTPEEMTDEELEEMIKKVGYIYVPKIKNTGVRNNGDGSKFYFTLTNNYDFEVSGSVYFPIFDENTVCREFLVFGYEIAPHEEVKFVVSSDIKWANVDWEAIYMFNPDNIDEYGREAKKRWVDKYSLGLYRKQKMQNKEYTSFVLDTQYLTEEELVYIQDIFKRNYDIVTSEN